MTKIAVWCRHQEDDVIGMGRQIPWKIDSDTEMFRQLIKDQNVVMGRLTYESLPEKTLPDCNIFVLTSDCKYKVSDKINHQIVEDVRDFKGFDEDFYIAGGAKVYHAFMSGGPKLMPDIVVDCVYTGSLDVNLKSEKVSITPCIEILKNKYFKVFGGCEKDGIVRNVYIKRGDFVDQAVLKSILTLVEES